MKKTEIKRKTPMKPGKGFAAMRTELRRTRLAPASGKKAAGKAVAMRARLRSAGKVKPTPEQLARWDQMYAIGCVACLLNEACLLKRVSYLKARTTQWCAEKLEIHHLLSGQRRLGHDFTVCLCRYHHQGDFLPLPGHSYESQAEVYGPSFGQAARPFRSLYGREKALLEYQNNLLALATVESAEENSGTVLFAGIDTAEDRFEVYFDWGKAWVPPEVPRQ